MSFVLSYDLWDNRLFFFQYIYIYILQIQTSPTGKQMPLVYVEEADADGDAEDDEQDAPRAGGLPEKRSGRYNRRYPWKRQQNSRYRT